MKKIIFLFFILFSFCICVNAETGSLYIKRQDEKGNDISIELLKNSKVKLYQRNCLIKTLMYDENGEIFVDNLEIDRYTVIEEIAPLGYELDKRELVIYFDFNRDQNIVLSSKKIEGTLIINKYYNNNDSYLLDTKSVFEIYKDNELVKVLESVDGVISEKLEYGKYLIKQVGGKKYYNYSEEFYVSITKTQNYKYDLYSDMELELKEIINESELAIKNKEQELINFENSLFGEEERLNKLKNELELKEYNLNKEYEQLNEEKLNLELLKEEINYSYEELNNKKEEVIELEEKINQYKKQLSDVNSNIDIKSDELEKIKIELNNKENELNILKDEITLLNKKIEEKESDLNTLENSIRENELLILKKEEDLLDIKNEISKDALVVEVPNTYKRNYNKLISKILIVIGLIIIIFSKRKVTNYR